ncbi:hypothetical protein ABL78_0351 [Leptomonas seymouri]|uniref:Uncharacterized protein n=1 Tax=Leptomonas seymouri TaxID=5684 RepID=A0A0N1PFJ4_LEPSE|nr:hypothetical protein ABL78_0351 [Leptomonas seymouri]|eukprot:KPI90591.1 hypothetical protein ABL78_0351 [Leptomonas seymouri]
MANLAAVLILVTGLPAAGKSSFLKAVRCYARAQKDEAFPLFGGARRGRVTAILQLDDLLLRSLGPLQGEDVVAHAGLRQHSPNETSFSPACWKSATQQLLHLTEGALRTCLSEAAITDLAEARGAVLPLIFVEDNMHLRSMRERYYLLCRRIEDEASQLSTEGGLGEMQLMIAMLELRFTVPLSVCIARNALRPQSLPLCIDGRVEDRSTAVVSHYVPAPVIVAMHTIFDWCRDELSSITVEEEKAEHSVEMNTSSRRWWKWTPTTQPWGLLELATTAEPLEVRTKGEGDFLESRMATAEELVEEFFTATLQDAAMPACRAQWTRVLQRRERRKQAKASSAMARQQLSEARVQTHGHELDLQLRAVAHTFLTVQRPLTVGASTPSRSTTAAFGKEISHLKKGALQRFKEESRAFASYRRSPEPRETSREEDTQEDKVAELHEACLVSYQMALVSLWEKRMIPEC